MRIGDEFAIAMDRGLVITRLPPNAGIRGKSQTAADTVPLLRICGPHGVLCGAMIEHGVRRGQALQRTVCRLRAMALTDGSNRAASGAFTERRRSSEGSL